MRIHRRGWAGMNALYSPESPLLLVISVPSYSTGLLRLSDDLRMHVHSTVDFNFTQFSPLAQDKLLNSLEVKVFISWMKR